MDVKHHVYLCSESMSASAFDWLRQRSNTLAASQTVHCRDAFQRGNDTQISLTLTQYCAQRVTLRAQCSSPKIPQMVTSRQKIPRTSFNNPGQFHPERPFGLVSGHRPAKSSSRSHSYAKSSSSSSKIHAHIILWTYFPDSCPVSALLPTTSTTQPPAEGETGTVNQRDIDLSGKGVGG